jgi:hypothetical protein
MWGDFSGNTVSGTWSWPSSCPFPRCTVGCMGFYSHTLIYIAQRYPLPQARLDVECMKFYIHSLSSMVLRCWNNFIFTFLMKQISWVENESSESPLWLPTISILNKSNISDTCSVSIRETTTGLWRTANSLLLLNQESWSEMVLTHPALINSVIWSRQLLQIMPYLHIAGLFIWFQPPSFTVQWLSLKVRLLYCIHIVMVRWYTWWK